MTERVKIIMVDTNVWADLYVPGRPLREASLSFFEVAQRDDVELTFTVDIARAVYRIVSHEAKRWVRQDKGSLPDAYAKAIASHAWDFMESMQEQATAVGSAIFGGGLEALRQVWMFILAPLVGGVLAAILYGCLHSNKQPTLGATE